jgi:hypothetical protein
MQELCELACLVRFNRKRCKNPSKHTSCDFLVSNNVGIFFSSVSSIMMTIELTLCTPILQEFSKHTPNDLGIHSTNTKKKSA